MTPVALLATAGYLPDRRMTAAELARRTGLPEDVIIERFGLRAKRIAAPDEHVSDLAVAAGRALLEETGVDPATIDVVLYFGSTYKEYPVWQAAPGIAHRLGAARAFALELDYVSCGAPVALRVARDMLLAEPDLGTVLAVAASRESYLLDYANPRSRFMFGFGDGAVAALLARGEGPAEVLGSHAITDGSLSLAVKVPFGGSVAPLALAPVAAGGDGTGAGEGSGGHDRQVPRRAFLDVADPAAMKERLDANSLPNFVSVAERALWRSGATLADLSFVFPVHVKRSMHRRLLAALGVTESRSLYLEDTGHMSGVDPLFALDRAARAGRLRQGDVILLLAAGVGYSWAATVIRWRR